MLLAVGESAPKATRFRVWLVNSRVTPMWGNVKLLEKYRAGPDYLDVTVEGNGSDLVNLVKDHPEAFSHCDPLAD
jgi:hypothetical protein